MASNYPHPNNGFFIDTVGLYALDEQGIVPAAAPAAEGGGEQPAGDAQPAAAAQPAAPVPTVTPRADGAVVHIVQSGDSFWSLAVKYAQTMGITPEEALTEIPALNNNPSVINSGDELIIVPPNPERAAAIAAGAEEQPAEEEATAEAEATAEEETAESSEAAQTPESENASQTAQGGSSNLSQALLQVSPSSICVQVYEDVNGDGSRADIGENPLADQAITLRRAGSTVSTYVTDGSGDLHCFESLEPDTYQVQIYPTAGYAVVGDDRWAVAMAEGVMIPVSFGLHNSGSAVADAGATDGATNAKVASSAETDAGGLANNIGLVILGIAVVLILVAGTGVYLLRRG